MMRAQCSLLLGLALALSLLVSTSSSEDSSTAMPGLTPQPGDVLSSKKCASMPAQFPFKKALLQANYNASTESLFLDLTDMVYKFCDDTVYHRNESVTFKVDLIATTVQAPASSARRAPPPPSCPQDQTFSRDAKSKLVTSVRLSPSNPVTLFRFVQGSYFLRLSECRLQSCVPITCSRVQTFTAAVAKVDRVCDQGPSEVTDLKARDRTRALEFRTCSAQLTAVVPLCTARQVYSQARVFTVNVGGADECFEADFYNGGGHGNVDNATLRVLPCRPGRDDDCSGPNGSSLAAAAAGIEPFGLLEHTLSDLSRNASYCAFYQLANPHCTASTPCFFYTASPVRCDRVRVSPLALLTEPMFIGVVSLTLVVSLALLMWTVVQCSKKRPDSPVLQQQALMKKPPRSLTEDDLEHISRLPSQEIVLVYFPDSTRFKELNRKFRNWLITLDVNDVKDIYDEKTSEDVLRDPEGWVQRTLGGPEKRIILVCSRLAYECLVTVKKGIASPKFVETDPHFGLLTRAINYLDKEMKGNYRNLICVRYEDLKICDRAFSSEAFNIVPGTEYVLPQHLEDVYRWIHPRDPRPECWAETRPEVRELLDAMRKYRLHDDNMFTVQFGVNGGAGVPVVGGCEEPHELPAEPIE